MPQTQNSYDSGASFNSVNIPGVTGILMYAHAYSNSAGGPNNDHRQAYIYQIQAWGIANPYTDIGLAVEKNGIVQRIGTIPYTGSNITNTNNLRINKNNTTYGIPFLTTQTATLLPSFNGQGYDWGVMVTLSPASAGTIQLFTNGGTLMAIDNGSGGWTSQPGFTITGGINGYGSGGSGYGSGLVLATCSPGQGSAPYIVYRDPQVSNAKIRSNGNNYYLPSVSTNLNVNLVQLPGTGHSYSGGNGAGSQSIDGDFNETAYGTNSPNEIDVYSTHIFTQPYTLTNINFRVEMLYYAYGNNVDTGNFNSEIYLTYNYGSSWSQWWGTSG